MILGIQVVGLFFGFVMLYLSHLYYRREEIRGIDFALWCSVWVAYLYAVMFPQALNVFLETLGVISAMDLFTIVSFMVAFTIIFSLYKTVRQLQRKIEKLVISIAHEELKGKR